MMVVFMIFPVISVFPTQYTQASAWTVSVVMGIHAIPQLLLQVPLGILSDWWGRKPVIGLSLIAISVGSMVAGMSGSMYEVALGRLIQGMGAVGGVMMALAYDYTPVARQGYMMMGVGVSVGLAFYTAVLIAPLLVNMYGLPGIFFFSGALSSIALCVLVLLPTVPGSQQARTSSHPITMKGFIQVLAIQEVRFSLFSVCMQHMILMIIFLRVPKIITSLLADHMGAPSYMSGMFMFSFICMLPMIRGLRGQAIVRMLLTGYRGMSLGLYIMCIGTHDIRLFSLGFLVFLLGFNRLEIVLPMGIARVVPKYFRGTAMGSFSMFQYMGVILGSLGGWGLSVCLAGSHIMLICAVLTTVYWAYLRLTRPAPISN